ncbi:GerAB/ArcD/ProY family transporter [Paenibacillus silviterrae]|uniref:GerAB/ArcD/ProY family transporter n=1 Tax=Paenibacillus silviterrae TaxID=3242194 RepID=UPI0035568F1B
MNDLQIINHRQFAWLTAALITGGGLLTIQHELVRVADMDAWFAYLLPTAYLFLVAFCFGFLAQRFPGMHIFEITKAIFGKIVGTLVNLVLLFHLWLILVRDLRSLGKFVGTILLPNTPDEMIILVLLLLLMFYGRTSVEIIARVNDFFLPILFGQFVLLPLFLSNEISVNLLQPILASPAADHLRMNYLTFGWYGDIFVMGAFLHTLWNARQIRAAVRHGTVISTFLLTLLLVLEVMVLGPVIPGNMVYPNYSLVQHIHLTDFLDRVDLPVLMIFFPILVCKICLIYLSFLNGVAGLLKSRDYTVINTPFALFLLVTSLLSFKSTTEVFSFGNYSSALICLSYQPLLLIAILLAAGRFPKRSPGKQSELGHGTGPVNRPKQSGMLGSAIGQRSYRTWSRIGNMLLALMMGLVAVGILLGRQYALVGTLCGIGYGVSLVLLLGTTHMEIQAAKEQNVLRANPDLTAGS